MAYTSFRLKYNFASGGSYARFNYVVIEVASDTVNPYDNQIVYQTGASGQGTGFYQYDADTTTWYLIERDLDNALRADGLQLPPASAPENSFAAIATGYNEVTLKYGLTELPAVSSSASGGVNISTGAPAPTAVIVVYSDRGEPQTVNSGFQVVNTRFSGSSTHNEETHPTYFPVSGKWAYYSLFVEYSAVGVGSYYEKVASLRVLLPYNYKSTDMLWNRLPMYYRLQDFRNATPSVANDSLVTLLGGVPWPREEGGYRVGDLYKFLSIFGFDIDRIRTTIDYMMVSRDPAIADTEVLDAMSIQLGVGLSSSDLGAERLRRVLHEIGYLRRSKGTETQIKYILRALSGSEVELDRGNGSAGAGSMAVYEQRVNYIPDPLWETEDRNLASWAAMVNDRPAHEDEVDTPLDFTDTTYNAYATGGATPAYSVTSKVYQSTGAGDTAGVTHVMFRLACAVPVRLYDQVTFSVHNAYSGDIKWVRVVDVDGNILGSTSTPKKAVDKDAYQVSITDPNDTGVTSTLQASFIEFLVDLSSGPFSPYQMIAERNFIGNYFDGNENLSGWVIDTVGGATNESIKDHRWLGTENDSVSVYTEQYRKTKGVFLSSCLNVLPVYEREVYTDQSTGLPLVTFQNVVGLSLLSTTPN